MDGPKNEYFKGQSRRCSSFKEHQLKNKQTKLDHLSQNWTVMANGKMDGHVWFSGSFTFINSPLPIPVQFFATHKIPETEMLLRLNFNELKKWTVLAYQS